MIFDKPFCRNSDYEPVVNITQSVTVEPYGSCGDTDTAAVRKIIIYLAICTRKAVVIFIGDYECGFGSLSSLRAAVWTIIMSHSRIFTPHHVKVLRIWSHSSRR